MSDVKDLKSSLLKSTFESPDQKIAVKAEDVQQNSSVDFSKIYFQPEYGKTYDIKFLPSIGESNLNTRQVYKSLPDPDRKGKNFHYVSSGNSKTCNVLDLFFELNNLKKNGDVMAEQKIKKYLGKSNEACVTIQVLSSEKQEEVGIYRLFSFSNFGPNAYLAKLIDEALNPSEKDLKDGEAQKEDIFNIFNSKILRIVCEKSNYPDPVTGQSREGRDFSKSKWLTTKRSGAIAVWEENGEKKTYQFKAEDYVDNKFTNEEAEKAFDKLAESLLSDDLSVRNWFMYTPIGHERNTKSTNEYLELVEKKVNEIIPIIREKTISEIANYGRKDSTPEAVGPDGKPLAKKDAATTIYNESLPEEFAGNSVFKSEGKAEAKPESQPAKTEQSTSSVANNEKLKSILNDDE